MKTFIATLILLTGSLALAKSQISREYNIVNAKFASEHIPHLEKGTITVNYTEQTVTLHANGLRSYPCKPNMACPAVMINVELNETLPITSIETDSCGISHITASEDKRPADGLLKVITVEDASQITCKTLVKYVERATYETAFFNMMTGEEAKAKSTMNLEAIETVVEISQEFKMAEGFFLEGFPSLEIPKSGHLTISKDTVTLKVNVGLNCKMGQPCPAYMPRPIEVTLPIVERNKGQCATEIVARSPHHMPNDLEGMKEIRIRDYSTSVCEMVYLYPIHVEYISDVLGFNSTMIQHAEFYFNFAPVYLK